MTPYIADPDFTLYVGDVREVLAEMDSASIDCCVTSPPYLDARSEYGTLTGAEWRQFFTELRRVVTGPALFNCGRIWRNGVESDWHQRMVRIAALAGWKKLDELIWVKPNANPLHGSVFANSHEYVYVLGTPGTLLNTDAIRTPYAPSSVARLDRGWTNHIAKKNIHSDRQRSAEELNEDGARPRSFVTIAAGRDKGNPHPAPMASDLAAHLVLLASWEGQTVLDPFMGSGTTAKVARWLGRKSVGIELNPEYAALCAKRLQQLSLLAERVA